MKLYLKVDAHQKDNISLSQFDRTEIKPYIEYFRDIFYISLPHEIGNV